MRTNSNFLDEMERHIISTYNREAERLFYTAQKGSFLDRVWNGGRRRRTPTNRANIRQRKRYLPKCNFKRLFYPPHFERMNPEE